MAAIYNTRRYTQRAAGWRGTRAGAEGGSASGGGAAALSTTRAAGRPSSSPTRSTVISALSTVIPAKAGIHMPAATVGLALLTLCAPSMAAADTGRTSTKNPLMQPRVANERREAEAEGFGLFAPMPSYCTAAERLGAETPEGCQAFQVRDTTVTVLVAAAAGALLLSAAYSLPPVRRRTSESRVRRLEAMLQGAPLGAAKTLRTYRKIVRLTAYAADSRKLALVVIRSTYDVWCRVNAAVAEGFLDEQIRRHWKIHVSFQERLIILRAALFESSDVLQDMLRERDRTVASDVVPLVVEATRFAADLSETRWDFLPGRLRAASDALWPPVETRGAEPAALSPDEVASLAEVLGATVRGADGATVGIEATAAANAPVDLSRQERAILDRVEAALQRLRSPQRVDQYLSELEPLIAVLPATPEGRAAAARAAVLIEAIKAEVKRPDTLLRALRDCQERGGSRDAAAFEAWVRRLWPDYAKTRLSGLMAVIEQAFAQLPPPAADQPIGIYADVTDIQAIDRMAVATAVDCFRRTGPARLQAVETLRQAANRLDQLVQPREAARLRLIAAVFVHKLGLREGASLRTQVGAYLDNWGATLDLVTWLRNLHVVEGLGYVDLAASPLGDLTTILDRHRYPSLSLAESVLARAPTLPPDLFPKDAGPVKIAAHAIATAVDLLRGGLARETPAPRPSSDDDGAVRVADRPAPLVQPGVTTLRYDVTRGLLAIQVLLEACARVTVAGALDVGQPVRLIAAIIEQRLGYGDHGLRDHVVDWLALNPNASPARVAEWVMELHAVQGEGYLTVVESPLGDLTAAILAHMPSYSRADGQLAAAAAERSALEALAARAGTAIERDGIDEAWRQHLNGVARLLNRRPDGASDDVALWFIHDMSYLNPRRALPAFTGRL